MLFTTSAGSLFQKERERELLNVKERETECEGARKREGVSVREERDIEEEILSQ